MVTRSLLIDDQNSVPKSTSQLSKELGYEVEVAGDGGKGSEFSKTDSDCNLVIMED